ncbi:class I SAM-dependent methyltransferase [Flavobacteriaceae bacterium]|nr:class I SAM-dependent methyltransferase [Flavobacteriaceae bacterium]
MNTFDDIKNQYTTQFKKFGDSPKSIFTPKGRNNIRYSVIQDYVKLNDELSILDYGCGLGYLYDYLKVNLPNLKYYGSDFVEDFISHCQQKFPLINSHFFLVDPLAHFERKYDIVFASGVFNIKSSLKEEKSKQYAFDKIKELFYASNKILICDFPSKYVDFQLAEAQHFSIEEIADFCVKNLSRKFLIRHDKLPYEFTLVVWKNDEIIRPQTIFKNE